MEAAFDQVSQIVSGYIPNLIGALAILVVGWLVALVLVAIVRGALRRTNLDNRLAYWIFGERAGEAVPVEHWVAKAVFYLVMIFVLVAFFQALGLTLPTEPLNRLLTEVFQFAPQLLGAALLLLTAWILASVLHALLLRVLTGIKLDDRLGGRVGERGQVSLSKTLADTVYWLVFLLFLPAILNALALQGLLAPVQGMVNKILGFLPNIFTAAVILGVGWFFARIVKGVLSNLLMAAGADQVSERVGLAPVLGTQRLSGLLGLVVYILILIPVLIAALDALALEAITRPASNMLDAILRALPLVFAAVLILAIAYVVGRMIAGMIANLLSGLGFNAVLARMGVGGQPGQAAPSEIAGYLVLVGVMLFASIEAAREMGFVMLADLVSRFTVFAGQVILGLIIFAIGMYLADLAAKTIQASRSAQAGLLALSARVSILVLAGAMALRQMGLASDIINLAFGLLLGAIAVAAALAFGLGARDIAARELGEWIQSIRSRKS